MSRKYGIGAILIVGVFAVIAVAIAWARFDRDKDGIPDFYLWKRFSGKAHAGQYAGLDGVTIYYETYGKGPPVLVLHGGAAFLETMHYQITDLASDHFVIAPDSRGHGRSSDGPGPLHYDAMAEDIVGLMNRLHIARADVVGWSDGGIVGLDLAMRHSDRIRRLVAIGANFDVAGMVDPASPNPYDSASLAGVRDFYHSVSPTPQNWPGFYAKVQRMWATEPHYAVADLGKIRAPVLVIAGEHDIVRRDHTDALARAIHGAREIIIPGASHSAPLEDPKTVDSAIRAFLSSAPV